MNQEIISGIERVIEEKSKYAKKLKSKFGKSTYYNLLKESLLSKFSRFDIVPFGSSEVCMYLLFSPYIHSELKRKLKSLKSLLREGEKEYLTSQLDEFNKTLNLIYSKAKEAEIPPILIEVGLKRWLKDQVDPKEFIPIHKKFNLMIQVVRDGQRKRKPKRTKLINYLKKAYPVPLGLSDIKISDFKDFIPNPNFFSDILILMADYFIPKVRTKTEKDKSGAIREKIRTTQESMKKQLVAQMRNVLKSADKFSIEDLHKALREMDSRVAGEEAKTRALGRELSRNRVIKDEGKTQIPGILRFYSPDLGKKIKENWDETLTLITENIKSIPSAFILGSFLGRKVDYKAIIEWFIKNYNEIFLPTLVQLILEEMIKVFPQVEVRKESIEEARWIGFLARKEKPRSVFFIPEINRELNAPGEIVRDYIKTVSVMVYDIRGSSIMGEKLQDGEMEDRIRNEFQRELLKAVRDTNGFLLKDTGDGGIVFFSENSGELFADYRASIYEGKRGFDEKRLKLISCEDATSRAVECGMKMIEYSQKFVRKNLKRYKDWFKEFDEKGVDFRGITYEKLPPEYKKIFQIGIGIASGEPEKDLFLGPNVIGHPDLTGNLVRRANTYSMVHHPERSVILIGTKAMCNFLLSMDRFKSSEESKKIESHSYTSLEEDLRKEVVLWMKGLTGNYRINDYNLSLKRIDYLTHVDENNLGLDIPGKSLKLKRREAFYDYKIGAERAVYEVIPENIR
ncbi:MAG: hypothetical protein U9N06_04955 [candidate division WOR-3 bacterium]|nr:hypothetical protein [candidate division WOR-3 bacterium]